MAINEEVAKKIPYESVPYKSIFRRIKDALPEGCVPTDKTPKIFGAIFTLVVIIGVLQFPLTGMFTMNTAVSAKIGIPLTFLELKLYDPTSNPVKIRNLVVDMLLYIFLSYALDIAMNIITHSKWIKSEEELKGVPKEYKIKSK